MGAWIETLFYTGDVVLVYVAPRVGAWIETLKVKMPERFDRVAPRVGAWIETDQSSEYTRPSERRTPCGCVD